MPADSRKPDAAEFDLTPMIDVTFLLIIFFMCVTEMAKVEYEQLTLPRAHQAVRDTPTAPSRQVVNIRYRSDEARGRDWSEIVVRGKAYRDLSELAGYLRQARERSRQAGSQNFEVKIRADGRAAYDQVQAVMMACTQAGIQQISIAAAPERQ